MNNEDRNHNCKTRLPDWKAWRCFFENRSRRDLPRLDNGSEQRDIPPSVARSLAIFQLGESGGGTVIKQAMTSTLPGIDKHYVESVALFVDEEHRHANILAICVRALGGRLISSNWTAKMFVGLRRLMGLRLKVLVLLAAEVVGLCYYSAIASRLPAGTVRNRLLELVDDERSHLEFHTDFLRSQTTTVWQSRVFTLVWRLIMFSAALAVLFDHRKTLKDLGIPRGHIWQRWRAFTQLAERMVTQPGTSGRRLAIPDPGGELEFTRPMLTGSGL